MGLSPHLVSTGLDHFCLVTERVSCVFTNTTPTILVCGHTVTEYNTQDSINNNNNNKQKQMSCDSEGYQKGNMQGQIVDPDAQVFIYFLTVPTW